MLIKCLTNAFQCHTVISDIFEFFLWINPSLFLGVFIIFPLVISRPNPSWWAKAYPDLIDRRLCLTDVGLVPAPNTCRLKKKINNNHWLKEMPRIIYICLICFRRSLSVSVGLVSKQYSRQAITGPTITTTTSSVTNQNVGCCMAFENIIHNV